MDLNNFSSGDELWVLIREINKEYYSPLNANILYLEEAGNTNRVIYMIELRDAYSHLLSAFDYEFSEEKGKENIKSHLSQYVDHLQNGLFDSYRKILNVQLTLLEEVAPQKDFVYMRYEIARKAAALRVMDESNSPEKRIQGYRELMGFISKIRNGLYMEKDTVAKLIEDLTKTTN